LRQKLTTSAFQTERTVPALKLNVLTVATLITVLARVTTGCLTDQQVWFPGVSRWHFDKKFSRIRGFKTV